MTVTKFAGAALSTAALCVLTALPAVAQPISGLSTPSTAAGERASGLDLPGDLLEPDTGVRPTGAPTTSPAPTIPAPTTSAPATSTSAAEEQDAPGEGEIEARYSALPREVKNALGNPLGDEEVESEELRWREYEHARFYWTPDTGVHIVFGGILDRFVARGGHDVLGVPTTDEEVDRSGARYTEFVSLDGAKTESAIYFTAGTGAHLLRGPILEKWAELGAGEVLGYPITDTTSTPDELGAYNHFSRPGGASIYLTRDNETHVVQGAIRDKWAESGWEAGPLGYPTTDELTAADGRGRYARFDGDGKFGAGIAWSPETGAHSVRGAIGDRYVEFGGPNGLLGYPTTDELSAPDGRGRYGHFTGTGGASIYWSPSTGAVEIYGGIRARWAQLGWERSYLGYPVRGEHDVPLGRSTEFELGFIDWHRDTGEFFDFPK
ncbi:LGFP repeat-containing protein [Saccharopolyspora sp. MS10]|uniref:LGFP repeat-containing protein n=1 Tax=Saccharopolyspora sp. MS10 TaxID=3385973 RepID=UPI0039A2CF10